jgi:hypothetical protein
MEKRMTKEEVATLELPEGCRVEWNFGWSAWWHGDTTLEARALTTLATVVANGYLPRALHDWAMRAYKRGEVPTPELWDARGKLLESLGGQLKAESDWRQQFSGEPPTPEQWEEAVRLAETVRADAHPDSIRAMMANIISPPTPPPLPEIAACPRCGGACEVRATPMNRHVACCSCNWEGPSKGSERDAIAGHNEEAVKLAPKEYRKCDNCRHDALHGTVEPCSTCHKVYAAKGVFPLWEPKP